MQSRIVQTLGGKRWKGLCETSTRSAPQLYSISFAFRQAQAPHGG
jgi:hypothetical protein